VGLAYAASFATVGENNKEAGHSKHLGRPPRMWRKGQGSSDVAKSQSRYSGSLLRNNTDLAEFPIPKSQNEAVCRARAKGTPR